MKNIEKIKEELQDFGKKYKACEDGIEAIKGDTLIELFGNIGKYMYWCRNSKEKIIEFNSIFGNDLVIEDGVLLCNCTGMSSIKIPSTVHTIGDSAFYSCIELASIKIHSSITSIGGYAFSFCKNLTSIVIPDSVISIGEGAFYCENLTSITIPNSVILEESSFYDFKRELK